MHCSSAVNSNELETTQMSRNNKYTVVYEYRRGYAALDQARHIKPTEDEG